MSGIAIKSVSIQLKTATCIYVKIYQPNKDRLSCQILRQFPSSVTQFSSHKGRLNFQARTWKSSNFFCDQSTLLEIRWNARIHIKSLAQLWWWRSVIVDLRSMFSALKQCYCGWNVTETEGNLSFDMVFTSCSQNFLEIALF